MDAKTFKFSATHRPNDTGEAALMKNICNFLIFGNALYYRPLQTQHCRGRTACGLDAYV